MSEHTGSVGPPIRANQMEPEVLRQMLRMVLSGSGVVGSGDLAVTQNGTPNMQVLVAAGFAVIAGTSSVPAQGMYPVYNDAGKLITIAASDPTNPRNDLIVATVRDSYYAGAQNDWILQVITGIANAVPVDPAIPANSLVLARIVVPHSVASIINAYITDRRQVVLPPRGQPMAKSYRSAAQTIGAGHSVLLMDADVIMTGGFTRVAGLLVVPVTGVYRVFTTMAGSDIVAGVFFQCGVSVNGATTVNGSLAPASANGNAGSSAYDLVQCNAGDALGIATYLASGTSTLYVGIAGVYITAELAA